MRDELEDALDVAVVEAGLEQALARAPAHEALGARAGVDPDRLHADDPANAALRGGGDPDQPDHLLSRQLRHRSGALERVAGRDLHLRPQRALPVDDVARDVVGERLDEERLADHHLLDRLGEELREAGHMDALLRRLEVDRAVDVSCDQLLGVAVADPDRRADAGDARAREAEADLRRRGLEVVLEYRLRSVHTADSVAGR